MSEADMDLNLLTVDSDRAGEEVRVQSTQDHIASPTEVDAYVDDDGTVRQESNGAAFNADVYEIIS
jgi:hypothetical protein